MANPLPADTKAPDFSLRSTPDQSVSLSDFRGRPVILAFYPADWSPVCGDQMALYNEILAEFQRFGAELLGISVDGVWCHLAFAHDRKLRFPAARRLRAEGRGRAASTASTAIDDGTSERALFVIDGDGIIRWSYVSPVGVNPGADGILTRSRHSQRGRRHDERRRRRQLTLPVSDRDHIAGTPRTRRSRWSSTATTSARTAARRTRSSRTSSSGWATGCASSSATSRLRDPPARAARRRSGRSRGSAGQVLGDARRALRAPARARRSRTWCSTRSSSAWTSSGSKASLAPTPTPPRVREDFISGVRSGVNGTPTFFINGIRYDGSWDAETLMDALSAVVLR